MDAFARKLLAWHACEGRHDLPWQQRPTPYRVWVSEIMLQQTQVGTVIPYYKRFMARFPDVSALAQASLDEVLALWAGLGYYARARNLHAAARQVAAEHNGVFPDEVESLQELPGIGRSTAAAIAALSAGRCHAILDGNVKRVLCRYHAVPGWPGRAAVERRLWALAEAHTPAKDVAAYTQAIMDLGATLCTRRRPQCEACPVADGCEARAQGREAEFPGSRPGRERPTREICVLIVRNQADEVLLERRPAAGVWAGLWSLPEVPEPGQAGQWCNQSLGSPGTAPGEAESIVHEFTHFRLLLRPLHVRLEQAPAALGEQGLAWIGPDAREHYGMPAPVQRLLGALWAN